MTLKHRIDTFVQLGSLFRMFGQDKPWEGYHSGLSKEEYNAFQLCIQQAHAWNGWFTQANVRKQLSELGEALQREHLEAWTSRYAIPDEGRRHTALITAGNIPLVGFHDMLCVLMAGHHLYVKVSSDDAKLTDGMLRLLQLLDDPLAARAHLVTEKLERFEAVIATGSNNTNRYFEYYFKDKPNLLRKNRTSVAVLEGDEDENELSLLGTDVFQYFGLGCRNVGKVFVPNDFDLDRLFRAFYTHHDIIHHNKYANNYDYHKAIFLMNGEKIWDNGFLLIKEDYSLHSPLGVLFVQRYNERSEVDDILNQITDELQCIVGRSYLPFGKSQSPMLDDYADGIDTMAFLLSL